MREEGMPRSTRSSSTSKARKTSRSTLPPRGAARAVAAPDHHGSSRCCSVGRSSSSAARARLSRRSCAPVENVAYELDPRRRTSMSEKIVTAAVLVIGDEILSGRTKDANIGYIAEYLTNIGIDLREARVVPDIEAEIVAALERAARAATTTSSPPAASARPTTTSPPTRSPKPSASTIDEDPRAHRADARARSSRTNSTRRAGAWRACPTAPNSIENSVSRRRASASATSSSWPACRR